MKSKNILMLGVVMAVGGLHGVRVSKDFRVSKNFIKGGKR